MAIGREFGTKQRFITISKNHDNNNVPTTTPTRIPKCKCVGSELYAVIKIIELQSDEGHFMYTKLLTQNNKKK